MRRVTLRDVARRAGVDTSTASRALSESASQVLNERTVARVVQAAEDLGYRPNALARGLRTNRTATIGMLVPDLANPLFWPIVQGIEDELVRSGYTLILANTDNDPNREQRATNSLLELQIDGIIIATRRLDHDGTEVIHEKSIPHLYVVNRPHKDVPFVVTDEKRGVDAVIEHLVGLGHRRIAHIAGPQWLSPGKARHDCYRRAVRRHELELDPKIVAIADAFTLEAGAKACHSLLTAGGDFTAIFAANDLIAVGCLETLKAEGLAVPGDVSLAGFNDMPLVDKLDPALTTVHVPHHEMGVTAARVLLSLIEGSANATPKVLVAPDLIIRSSTAKPPGRRK